MEEVGGPGPLKVELTLEALSIASAFGLSKHHVSPKPL